LRRLHPPFIGAGRRVATFPDAMVPDEMACDLARELVDLRAEMCRLESAFEAELERVHPARRGGRSTVDL